jgi:pimeloyl-ACP methyl ester carboxylesterase
LQVHESLIVRSIKLREFGAVILIAVMLLTTGCVSPRPKPQPDLAQIFRPAREQTGKPPIIVIPGMLGTRLENKLNGEKVWPRAHPNEVDLRLPISLELKNNRSDVIATEVVERAKVGFPIPEIKVYEDLINTLTDHAGYKRGNIDEPLAGGAQDTVYLFAYDWRRDNVETAQLLAAKITRLKEKLSRPDLRFNIIAHSMGGLIARYYLMYGGIDLRDEGEAKINWAGGAHINKLILVGAPNEGSMEALRALTEGLPIAENSFGLFGKIEADTAFTMPAAFQLLPHRRNQEFYNDKLQPIAANLYDIETWRRYQWSIYAPSYRETFVKKKRNGADGQQSFAELLVAREAYLKLVLDRARRFSEALDQKADLANPLKVFIFAGDCERTLRAALIIDEGSLVRTIFKPGKLKVKDNGLTTAMIEAKMFEPGDGRITRRSALAIDHGEWAGDGSPRPNLSLAIFGCEIHGDLPNNATFQNNILTILLK